MKAFFGSFILVLAFTSAVFAQHPEVPGNYSIGHDSLLFDGSPPSVEYIDSKCGCAMKILLMKGSVYGTVCEHKISSVCGVKDTSYNRKKMVIPPNATKVLDGDTLTTDNQEGCMIQLKLDDGKKISLMKGTSIAISSDHCKHPPILVLRYGMLYLDLTGGNHSKTIITKTEQGEIINQGTRYSVELTKDGDTQTETVKVYEGSVTFKPNTENKNFTKGTKDKGEQIKQLNADFQAGKITREEFAAKLKELTSDYKAPEIKEVTVEAGYQSTITANGNPTDPVQFDVSTDPGPIQE